MKLTSWFEIDDLEYCQYVLQGYEITTGAAWVMWRLDGECHRTDGPAVIWADGLLEWWLNGCRHRTDGPAAFNAAGDEWWYLNDKELTEDEWRIQVDILRQNSV